MKIFSSQNYSSHAREITRSLCKINGVEINYFAHLGDKCRFKHEFLNACRHATTFFGVSLSSPGCLTFGNRTIDAASNFHPKMGTAAKQVDPLLKIKLYSRNIVFAERRESYSLLATKSPIYFAILIFPEKVSFMRRKCLVTFHSA